MHEDQKLILTFLLNRITGLLKEYACSKQCVDYNNHSLNILTVRFIVVLNQWLKLRSTSNVLFCWAIIVNALSLYYSVSLSLSLLPAMRRLSIFFLIVSYSFFSSIFYSLFCSFSNPQQSRHCWL